MFVQEVTEDAAKEIVTKRAHPIAAIKDVVEYKHDSCTKQRIDHTYYKIFNLYSFPKISIQLFASPFITLKLHIRSSSTSIIAPELSNSPQ